MELKILILIFFCLKATYEVRAQCPLVPMPFFENFLFFFLKDLQRIDFFWKYEDLFIIKK